MITQLQIGKKYRIKDYNTLVKEHYKYRTDITIKDLDNKYSIIASKEFIPLVTYEYNRYFTYGYEIPGYEGDNIDYVIWPHEVIEFEDINNLNIF